MKTTTSLDDFVGWTSMTNATAMTVTRTQCGTNLSKESSTDFSIQEFLYFFCSHHCSATTQQIHDLAVWSY
jgi:hypothetical protein